MQRKKPEGELWERLVKTWNSSNHEGKMNLVKEFNTTYGTMKHWLSDSGFANNGEGRKPEELKGNLNVADIIALKPAVELDFVCFDLETSNLKADFSVTLTGCIKPFGKEAKIFRADNYKTWEKNRADDSHIITDISNELRKHAVVVTHYGTGFDIPFLRAKMVKHGLEPLPPMFALDSYLVAKANFQVGSRKLSSLAAYFDLGEKTEVEGGLWMKAAYDGDKKAMDLIVDHNVQDCIILEKLACLSFPFLKSIRRL